MLLAVNNCYAALVISLTDDNLSTRLDTINIEYRVTVKTEILSHTVVYIAVVYIPSNVSTDVYDILFESI